MVLKHSIIFGLLHIEMRGRDIHKTQVPGYNPPQPNQFIQSLLDGIQFSVIFSSFETDVQPVLRNHE